MLGSVEIEQLSILARAFWIRDLWGIFDFNRMFWESLIVIRLLEILNFLWIFGNPGFPMDVWKSSISYIYIMLDLGDVLKMLEYWAMQNLSS